MKVLISGKQMQVSDPLRAYVQEHLVQQLSRFYDNEAAELRVEFGRARGQQGNDVECHLTLHMPGAKTLQIEEETGDAYASLDVASDRLLRICKREIERMREPAGHHVEHPLATQASDRPLPEALDSPIE